MRSVLCRILRSYKDTPHGPSDWIRTSGQPTSSGWPPGGGSKRAFGAEAAGSGCRYKKQSTCFFKQVLCGPSDWIRTSGLLNPIQARYQTSPHPDLAVVPDSSYILPRPREKSKSFFKKFSAEFFAPPRGGEGRRGRLRTARGGPAHRPRTGRFPPPR